MRIGRKIGTLLAAAAWLAPALASGDEAAGTGGYVAADADLRLLVEDLRQEVALLRRQQEVQVENQERTAGAPLVGAGPDGFYLRSPDRAFEIRLRGYTHFDGRYFTEDDEDFNDSFLFRRVRPLLEGTLAGIADFRIMPDFAGSALSLQDAYVNLRYFPLANLQAGKFKAPFGLERLQSATAIVFPERALPTNLVPNRDLGFMLHGSLGEGIFQYQLALMNGVADGGSSDLDNGDGKDVVARVFSQPFQDTTADWLAGLGLGFAFNYGDTGGAGAPATYRTAGQNVFFRYLATVELGGERLRYSPQLYYAWGPFGLLGEYVRSTTGVTLAGDDEEFDNQAWQLAASWVLTGENASFRGVLPAAPVSLENGAFGAFEVAARYNEFYVDPDAFDDGFANPAVSAETARAFGVALNWYLNRWLELSTAYERTFFEKGAGATGDVRDRGDESVVFMRTQLSF